MLTASAPDTHETARTSLKLRPRLMAGENHQPRGITMNNYTITIHDSENNAVYHCEYSLIDTCIFEDMAGVIAKVLHGFNAMQAAMGHPPASKIYLSVDGRIKACITKTDK